MPGYFSLAWVKINKHFVFTQVVYIMHVDAQKNGSIEILPGKILKKEIYMPNLLIPLVNEAFQTNYPLDADVKLYNNEFFIIYQTIYKRDDR